MSFKINAYDPTKGQAYAPRIRHEDWEKHRDLISNMHTSRTPRKVMIKRLRDEHNFKPTLGQLQAKCKDWNLKVYAKEGIKSPSDHEQASNSGHQAASKPAPTSTFDLAFEASLLQDWSTDLRVHPAILSAGNDFTLPPVGLLANTVDSHWPVPDDFLQAEAMLKAAHFYHAVDAFQQAFSIYRAVYLYQRRHYHICDPVMVRTILFSARSAVTDHQRNIVHSVLCEVGSSPEFDNLSKLYIDCLQSASLSMISSDTSCELECGDMVRARATAYLQFVQTHSITNGEDSAVDAQAMLYKFEHALLMQEHEHKVLSSLLSWVDSTVDQLRQVMDDIFVGQTQSEEEYYRRVGQKLSGFLLTTWHKHLEDHEDDLRVQLIRSFAGGAQAFDLDQSITQTLVALSFMTVDAVRCDPSKPTYLKFDAQHASMWFLDAAKLFRRGTRMLVRLDDRSRCAIFSEIFLERFYTSVSYRQKVYSWTVQLPAIVDSIGMALAQQNMSGAHLVDAAATFIVPSDTDLELSALVATDTTLAHTVEIVPAGIAGNDTAMVDAPSPMSDCNSISSFIQTYRRTLKQKLASSSKSSNSKPADVVSFTSSTDFRFGMFSSGNDADSLWHKLLITEPA